MILADIANRNAKLYGDKTAIVAGPTRYTFREFNNRVNSLVNALSALGVNKEDKVVLMSENCHQCAEITFAAIKGGLVLSPLNPHLPEGDISYLINNAEANTLIFGDYIKNTVDSIRAELKGVKNLIIIGAPQGEMKGYEELIASCAPDEPVVEFEEEDLLFLFYSGGTTGRPKQVMHTRKTALQTLLNFFLGCHLIHDDVYLLMAPPYWGQILLMMAPLVFYGGSTLILPGDTSPESILNIIHQEKATVAVWPGPFLSALVDYPDVSKYDMSHLRYVMLGGIPPAPQVLKQGIETFGQVFGQMYGLTEHTALTWLDPDALVIEGPPEKTARLRSCGREGFNILIKIVDDNGNEVPVGEVGELISTGYGMMSGYWKAPEATKETMKGGYLWTGDLATRDEDGFIYLMGRRKDAIVSAGKTISPSEVEDILCQHSSVQEAGAIGIPDDELGEVIKAVIVLKSGRSATEEEIINLCRQNLPDYAVPKSVIFVDSLPRSSLGRVLKRVLRDQYSRR